MSYIPEYTKVIFVNPRHPSEKALANALDLQQKRSLSVVSQVPIRQLRYGLVALVVFLRGLFISMFLWV